MTQEHPITPPPELVREWAHESPMESSSESWAYEMFIAHRAAQWGADQELEACCEWLDGVGDLALQLRAARRPKPPSLKEQALDQLRSLQIDLTRCGMGISVETMRRALESLPD